MSIGFYNFPKLHTEELQTEILKRFEEIVKSNGFVEGKYNKSFEAGFSEKLKAKHTILCANGTDALEIALQTYGIGHGDKVAVAAITFYATAEAVINRGAEVVFVDVDPQTGLMDPASLERTLDQHSGIKAVIPVHIYGMPAPIEAIEKICRPKGIHIVEDGAQAVGGKYENGTMIGSSENLTTWSFYPTKNIGAFGDAGAITTHDSDTAEEIRSIGNHGRSPEGHRLIGRNSRCDHLQAAVLDAKMPHFDEYYNNRVATAKKYFEAFDGVGVELVPAKYLDLSSWHLFPIRLKDREQKYALKEFLAEKKIGSALFYEKAMPEEKPLTNIVGEKTNAIDFAARTLCLPMHSYVADDEVVAVVEAVKEFLK